MYSYVCTYGSILHVLCIMSPKHMYHVHVHVHHRFHMIRTSSCLAGLAAATFGTGGAAATSSSSSLSSMKWRIKYLQRLTHMHKVHKDGNLHHHHHLWCLLLHPLPHHQTPLGSDGKPQCLTQSPCCTCESSASTWLVPKHKHKWKFESEWWLSSTSAV